MRGVAARLSIGAGPGHTGLGRISDHDLGDGVEGCQLRVTDRDLCGESPLRLHAGGDQSPARARTGYSG